MSKHEKGDQWPEPRWSKINENQIGRFLPGNIAGKFDAELGVLGQEGLRWIAKYNDSEEGIELQRYDGRTIIGAVGIGPSPKPADEGLDELEAYKYELDGTARLVMQIPAAELTEMWWSDDAA